MEKKKWTAEFDAKGLILRVEGSPLDGNRVRQKIADFPHSSPRFPNDRIYVINEYGHLSVIASDGQSFDWATLQIPNLQIFHNGQRCLGNYCNLCGATVT